MLDRSFAKLVLPTNRLLAIPFMKRRQFVYYATLAASSYTVAACSSQKNTKEFVLPSPAQFGAPETKDVKIGYVPCMGAIPLIAAVDRGFFSRYKLNVTLERKASWDELYEAIGKKKVDAAITSFAWPLWTKFGKDKANIVGLMGMNLNGNGILMSERAWKEGLRPIGDFNNKRELNNSYNEYVREYMRLTKGKLPGFGSSHRANMGNYVARYWLASILVNPDYELKYQVLADNKIPSALKANQIDMYAGDDIALASAIDSKAGFIAYSSRDLWEGHPDTILSAGGEWVKSNPKTARAMMAAILEGCQFVEHPVKQAGVPQLVGSDKYLKLASPKVLQPIFTGQYNYGSFDDRPRLVPAKDAAIFQSQEVKYLQAGNHANVIWHSQAAWVLTQMVRWQHQGIYTYPTNADKGIAEIYPKDIYQDVAKALKIDLPKERIKKETGFIDGVAFDPAKPAEYINGFDIRAGIGFADDWG
jgi:nitrate/nitrite transport system substrate-binding protein